MKRLCGQGLRKNLALFSKTAYIGSFYYSEGVYIALSKESDNRSGAGNREVIALLNQIGERLIRNEHERESIQNDIQTLTSKLEGVEISSSTFEAGRLKMQDQIKRALNNEIKLSRRQDDLEAQYLESLEKIEKAAALADKIEEAMALQARAFRRLDKMSKDKTLLLRKIENIEGEVHSARQEMRQNALVLSEQENTLPIGEPANDRTYKGKSKVGSLMMAASVSAFILASAFGGWTYFKNMDGTAGFDMTALEKIFGPQREDLMNEFAARDTNAGTTNGPALSDITPPNFVQTEDVAAAPSAQEQQGTENSFDTWLADFAEDQDEGRNTEEVSAAKTQNTEALPKEAPNTENDPLAADSTDEGSITDAFPYNMAATNKADKEPSLADRDEALVAGLDKEPHKKLANEMNAIAPTAGAGRSPQDLTAAIDLNREAPTEVETALAVANDEVIGDSAQTNGKVSKVAFKEDNAKNYDAVENFLAAQKRTVSLAKFISRDPSLPASIKEIEDKAFEGIPEAQHDLAAIYTAGHAGVKIDYGKAAQWFTEAGVNGVPNARYNLGVLYHQGLGVEQNMTKALGWYKAAARLDHPEALYNLGIAHLEGIGTKYSPHLAAGYFEKAAKMDVLEAAYNLGLIHENGLLGKTSYDEALIWYQKAAALGSPEAMNALDDLGTQIGMDQDAINTIKNEAVAQHKANKEKASIAAAPKPADSIGYIPNETTETQNVIAEIQENLIDLGLFPGPANGTHSLLLEDAIRAYQRDNKMSMTGMPSAELLSHMDKTKKN